AWCAGRGEFSMSQPTNRPNSTPRSDDWVRVGTLAELETSGMTMVRSGACPLLVVHDRGQVFALDNRCPHLGFPLHRGSVERSLGCLDCRLGFLIGGRGPLGALLGSVTGLRQIAIANGVCTGETGLRGLGGQIRLGLGRPSAVAARIWLRGWRGSP